MAKCNHCGKATTFGHNRSFSQRATNRTFKPNLQKVSVMDKFFDSLRTILVLSREQFQLIFIEDDT